MSKRDYKSYNVLAEELEIDKIIEVDDLKQDAKDDLDHVVEVEHTNEEVIEVGSIHDVSASKQEDIPITNQEVIEVPQVLLKKVSDDKQMKDKREGKEPEVATIDLQVQGARIKHQKQAQENQKVNGDQENTFSFDNYKDKYQKKNTNKAIKRTVGVLKILVLCMLSPVILILLGCIFAALAVSVVGIGACFVVGAMLIGMACFMSTQLHTSMIALLVSAGISGVSLGGILLILFIIGLKWSIGLIKKLRKSKQVTNKEGQ